MAAALIQFLPNAVDYVFRAIQNTAAKIRDTAQRVKANKNQCTRLSERIDIIIGFLQTDRSLKHSNMGLKKGLEQFEAFLQRCLKFMKKFVKSGWFNRIIRNSNYQQQFQEFNQELSQQCQDLSFGLAYTLYKVFAVEDAEDAKNDLQEIIKIVQTQPALLSNLPGKVQTNILHPAINNSASPMPDQFYHYRYSVNRRMMSHHLIAPNYLPQQNSITGRFFFTM